MTRWGRQAATSLSPSAPLSPRLSNCKPTAIAKIFILALCESRFHRFFNLNFLQLNSSATLRQLRCHTTPFINSSLNRKRRHIDQGLGVGTADGLAGGNAAGSRKLAR
ncbi:uncharacterized protein BO66DRAFT_58375 [Aspergillus aculeatinus CBS 121060]|uniref:Uncharacterized protein n=1 Tax=Aspergillus aculeatinus CBS 121060 TaxID=1448322 RepID=A0ACD1HCD1_9EURO|nr:hypothetical protein BO66DRAFT_58375 [Aspergillus aculeatinus CBS 121060]RAH71115.1 hypothetical protein BO66DRAFT_58375 [Aspergillus aculeatinus CBS 121060]